MRTRCIQCGATLEVVETEPYFRCPYCNSQLYLSFEKTCFHYLLTPVIEEKELKGIIERWLSFQEVRGSISLEKVTLIYFPFWLFGVGGKNFLCPASSTLYPEFKNLSLSGDLKFYTPGLVEGREIISPGIFVEVAWGKVKKENPRINTEPERISLVHYPLYELEFRYKRQNYHAVIEGIKGEVFAGEAPPSPSLKLTRYFTGWIVISFSLFIGESVFLPSFILLIAYPVTFFLLYFLAKKILTKKNGNSTS